MQLLGKAKGKMFQPGAQKQRGDCSVFSYLDVVVSPTVTVFQPWSLQVSAKFLLISCPYFVVCHLVLGDISSFSAPQCERGTECTSERAAETQTRTEAGVKKKTKQGRDRKVKIKSLLSHIVILYQLSFSFPL